MLTYFQAVILGSVQGLTELFPVSSLGHTVILPKLLNWNLDQSASFFLVFIVATHLATSLALLGFFWKDWVLVLKGILRSLKERRIGAEDVYARLGWLIVVATIPAGILGLLFEDKLKILFASPRFAAVFLVLNGIILFGAEKLRKIAAENEETNGSDGRIARLSWKNSVKIGFAQALALVPGFSRTGSALGGGLLVGLNHEDAARFSFLLATPIIFAAAVLKLPELIAPGNNYPLGPILAGSIFAAAAAYFSVKFLSRYFKTKTLSPFAAYCVAAGILSSLVFLLR